MNSGDRIINQDSSLERLETSQEYKFIDQLDRLIFDQVGALNDYRRDFLVTERGDVINTIFVQSRKNTERTFYLGHGFGGSSLMYFPCFKELLERGNILVWETRGMGFGIKKAEEMANREINSYYVDGLAAVVKHYQHDKIAFICHSLSSYILMRFLLENPKLNQIEKIIFFSPVGFTPKQEDKNNTIKSFSDLMTTLLNKFGWKFNLTFKSPLRTICCCLKKKLLTGAFADLPITALQKQVMVELFLGLTSIPDGSENLFFRYFLPRVLPQPGQSLCELFDKKKPEFSYKLSAYFGGQKDWVDKTGLTMLADKFKNIGVHVVPESDHMVLMNFPKVREIIASQFPS